MREGYDDLDFLCHLVLKGSLKDFQLQELRVRKVGHRMRILAALEERIGFYIDFGVIVQQSKNSNNLCCAAKKIHQKKTFKQLSEVLADIQQQNYLPNLVAEGFDH